ncbi:MAG: hypothetical protein ACOCUS_02440, partial [Polyangiales bacterium]
DPSVADLHRGQPEAWVFEGVPARRWNRAGYRYAPPAADARELNDIPADVLERMRDEGYSFWLSGRAEKEGDVYTFEWGLPLTVDNDACINGTDETEGLVVANNAVVEAEITVHLDHLFFDSYATDEPSMRFDPIAAVADSEGRVTLEALASQSLSDMRGLDGEPLTDEAGDPVVYDPGSLDLAERNLQEFVLAAATTTGHFNGEGHCEYTRE